ncbi:hypothetical protein G3480_19370 [Thiorhodococcus mannitoliphagus]|uniref:Nucleotidyltransferase family protein n=1 Tax=Thiorhodococcus mannitoliphagus TaxID=329406 RepID=A0A6P1DY83_9GAMM|nr:hypothetical protein [Thiorhodococcus mannitoliphagus]NEX22440.1 hypothetical protein [Thiorhodococcus mannitoliphagus]
MPIGKGGRLSWLRRLLGVEPSRAPSPIPADQSAEYTRPATWEDVLETVRLLNREGVRYVLVGGYALAANGYVRMTEVIDIAVAPDPENAARWIAALADLPDGASRALAGEEDPFEGDYLHAIRINDVFTVDVLPSVAGIGFEELAQHIVWLDLDREPVPVLDLEGLLKTKQGVRPKDQADARILREALRRLKGNP